MKVVFMGTPEIAVSTLEALARAHEVVGVISQPDKPKDRGKKVQFTPVKEKALELGLEVYQPKRIKSEESFELIQNLNPDIIVVIAYGQILPARVLDYPKHGTINIHGSLLPKYRGAAPIQWAILNGETETGITIMQMDVGMDTGDMILKDSFPLPAHYTSGDLFEHMAKLAPTPLLTALKQIEDGTAIRTPQGDDFSHAPMLSKEMGHLDWNKTSAELVCTIHGLNPWPGAYAMMGDEVLKIWRAEALSSPEYANSGEGAGQILSASAKDGIIIKTTDGALLLLEVQKKGSKKLSGKDFVNGNPLEVGRFLN